MDVTESDVLDTFKAAALSVTKLYKSSVAVATKSRTDGYQECLEDILAFLDRSKLVNQPAGAALRQWALERQDGRDTLAHVAESDDDADKPEPPSSPVMQRANLPQEHPRPPLHLETSDAPMNTEANNHPMPTTVASSHAPEPIPTTSTTSTPSYESVVFPTRDNFTFTSSMQYPQHSGGDYPNMAGLELSDSHGQQQQQQQQQQRPPRSRIRREEGRGRGARSHVRPTAGQKRRINFDELFDVDNISHGKDSAGGSSKRSRLS